MALDIGAELARMFGLNWPPRDEELSLGSELLGNGGYLSFRRAATVRKTDGRLRRVFVKWSDTTRQELGQLRQVSAQFCRSECLFYGLLGPLLERAVRPRRGLELELPGSFGQRILDTGTVLVLEDLTALGYRQLSVDALGTEHAYCASQALARLQAAFWTARGSFNGALDADLLGPDSPFSEAVRRSGLDLRPMVARGAAYFADNVAGRAACEEDARTLMDCLDRCLGPLLRDPVACIGNCRGGRPAGLVHGDLWPANVMFKTHTESGGLVCRLLDWQFWEVGLFGLDLGLLMLTCLSPQAMLEHVDRLPVNFYRTFRAAFESATGGPAPFTEAEALANMGEAMFWALFWVFTSCNVLWEEAGRVNVANLLANAAFVIRTNRVALPDAS